MKKCSFVSPTGAPQGFSSEQKSSAAESDTLTSRLGRRGGLPPLPSNHLPITWPFFSASYLKRGKTWPHLDSHQEKPINVSANAALTSEIPQHLATTLRGKLVIHYHTIC